MERFELRFESALERLADEVPTAVDAAEVARSVAAQAARPRWSPGTIVGTRSGILGRAGAARLALVAVLLLLLSLGLFALAQRIEPTPVAGPLTGRMDCAGSPWTSAAGPVVLECAVDLPDAHLAGPVRIVLGEGTPSGGFTVRAGTLDGLAPGESWAGELEVTVAPSGMAVGDAVLTGHENAARLTLRAHLVSADGLRWGLLGWLETAR